MLACQKEPHYHLMIRLLDCSSGTEVYAGTLQTEALYAYDIDEKNKASTIRDIINVWKDRRFILENEAIVEIAWNNQILSTNMLLREIEIDGEKLPLYTPPSDKPIILRYWLLQ